MIDHHPLPIQNRPERRHLYRWVKIEEGYVAEKYDDHRDHHDEMMRTDFDWWITYINRYLSAARVFLGDDLVLQAQQQMCKAFMTTKGMCESAVRTFGPLPRPGVPSGSIEQWHTGAILLKREIEARNG